MSNIREVKKIIEVSEKSLKDYCRMLNMNIYKIKEALDMPYIEYREVILEEVANSKLAEGVVLHKNREGRLSTSNIEAAENINRLFQFLDNYYSFKTSKNFIIEASKISGLVNKEGIAELKEVDFDACGDFFIDVSTRKRYIPIAIKFLKAEYQIEVPSLNRKYTSYNVSVLTTKDDVISDIWSGIFIPDLYPRLYVDYRNYKDCKVCKYKNSKVYNILEMGSSTPLELCLVGKRSFKDCRLLALEGDEEARTILNMHTILGVVAHICKVFPNRANIKRKNSRIRKTYDKASIHVARNGNSKTEEDKILSLDLYAKQEKQEKKEWQGGTHSSPVEHVRRGHIRRYRDEEGNVIKEVEIRPLVINKGNKRGVYKV